MSIDRMIVKVAGAAWRIITVGAEVAVAPAGTLPIDILAQLPGGSYGSIFTIVPSILPGAFSASGGIIRGDRRILPIGTLVRLGDNDNNVEMTVELHYRTRAVGQ